jgi:hypothetical protein
MTKNASFQRKMLIHFRDIFFKFRSINFYLFMMKTLLHSREGRLFTSEERESSIQR